MHTIGIILDERLYFMNQIYASMQMHSPFGPIKRVCLSIQFQNPLPFTYNMITSYFSILFLIFQNKPFKPSKSFQQSWQTTSQSYLLRKICSIKQSSGRRFLLSIVSSKIEVTEFSIIPSFDLSCILLSI
ncbi:hypothetical protein FGO68_gene14955 [Halteria grandinella]|uniref:Uncharacterized protein n=1 Tax=Halteria grandinella TaxID=5974 RepID=A0A8J8NRQ7_HALGN|nr:hypothetical protein FGO68_gene14955 [Halteria grandinella]